MKKMFFFPLVAILAALILTACGPVVPEGTILPAKAGQILWFAPGGDESPDGYSKELLTHLEGGEQLIVTPDNEGVYQSLGLPQVWLRVEVTLTSVAGTQTLTGWINFSQMTK